MKFLLHTNAPWVSSGYGVQCAQLMDRLAAVYGPENVACSSTYGQQGNTATWHGMRVYPQGYDPNGNDVLHGHADHFFQGDREAGWIIPLIDVWAMTSPMLADFQVATWVPVDHFPCQPNVLQYFHRTGSVAVAMSKFGEAQLRAKGLDPAYVPLTVDTSAYKPLGGPDIVRPDKTYNAREAFNIPQDAGFVVGMVAMNKGWARDRKGFNEAFRAFANFWQRHQDAILYMHTEKFGGGGVGYDLTRLAINCGVPEHAIVWSDQYAYRLGFDPPLMAALYSQFDVLLAPSHGEGFCVPLIEAQACGVPVIATDATAQTELVGDAIKIRWDVGGAGFFGRTENSTGWLVSGSPEWDPAAEASYVCPHIEAIILALEDAAISNRELMGEKARLFAGQYDADLVFERHWKPFLATLEPAPPQPLKEPIPDGESAVAVIVPVLNRPHNVIPLSRSLWATTNDVNLYFVADVDDTDEIIAIEREGEKLLFFPKGDLDRPATYAEKANYAFDQTTEPWVLVVGDDVKFHNGWLDAARKVSERADVVGTNDSLPGRVRNPDVADGRHADHFLVRREYVEDEGSSLEGPGVLMPEVYRHWHVDKEVVGLARARGRFVACLDSVVEHNHPGYDGREDLRQADKAYMLAVQHAETDRAMWLSRVPLIEMQRVTRAK